MGLTGDAASWPADADYRMWRALQVIRRLHRIEDGKDRFGTTRSCCVHCSALAARLIDGPCPTITAADEVNYEYPY